MTRLLRSLSYVYFPKLPARARDISPLASSRAGDWCRNTLHPCATADWPGQQLPDALFGPSLPPPPPREGPDERGTVGVSGIATAETLP